MKKHSALQIVFVGLAVIAFFVLPHIWGWPGLPFFIIVALVLMTILLVRWHARSTGYRCPECEYTFVISPLTDFLSPHTSGQKMLRCPRCMESSWCLEINRTSVIDESPPADRSESPPPYSAAPLHLQIWAVISLYIALWIITVYRWPALTARASLWTVLKIPIVTVVLVIMQATFNLYGARRGYRSRIYILITIFVAAFLLLAIWIQFSQLGGMI